MANFEYTAKSSFKPFTFEEMLRPLAMYTDLYNAIEEGIAELGGKADLMRMYANELTDSKAAAMYNKYANDLDLLAESLAKQGLSPSSRQGLLDLKRRYSSEITPIELAVTRRAADIKALLEGRQRDNTIMYSRDASVSRLDDYINNPSLSYTPVSGALITKRVADAITNYSKGLLLTGDWRSTASGQLLERINTTGLTPEDIKLIRNNPDAFPEILNLITNVVNSTGVLNWEDNPKAAQDALEYAYEGLFAGLGKREVDIRANLAYLNPYEQWKFDREKKAAEDGDNNPPDRIRNLIFTWEGTEIEEALDYNALLLNQDLNYLGQYRESLQKGEVPRTLKETRYRSDALDKANRLFILERDRLLKLGISLEDLDKLSTYTSVKNTYLRLLELEKNYEKMGLRPQGITYQEDIINPALESYERLSKEYGTADINELITRQTNEIKKKAKVNKFAYLNSNVSNLASRFLSTALFQGIDLLDEDLVEKVITKVGDDTVPTQEEIGRLFNGDVRIGVNPLTKKVRIFNKDVGTYEVDRVAAFHNIGISTVNGVIPASNYLDMIGEAYLLYGGNQYSNEDFDKDLEHFFNTLYARYSSGALEAPNTDSNASLFVTEADYEKAKEAYLKEQRKKAK